MTKAPLRAYLLFLLLLMGCLVAPVAAHANVVCKVTSEGINFGTVNVSTAGGATASGSIGYECTNYNPAPAANFTLCIGYGNNPSYPGTASQPAMTGGSPPLNFNLYTNAANGQVWSSTNSMTSPVYLPAGNGSVITGSVLFYGAIPGNQTSPPGAYTAQFYNTVIGSFAGTQCAPSNGDISGLTFTLHVNAVVSNACTVSVSATNIDFGNQPSTATSLAGNNTITVDCLPGSAYTVGLIPSNGNTAGSGVMRGTGTNTDTLPYQLRSSSASGPSWGNAAGNMVSGTSTGKLNAYATVVDANRTPDAYSDTVTVTVKY